MKRWRIMTVCAALATAAMLVAHLKWQKPEPTYQGQSLWYWAEQLDGAPDGPEGQSTAAKALRVMAPEAMPHLLRWLEIRRSPINQAYAELRRSLPSAIEDHLPEPRDPDEVRYLALWAIRTLGPQASAAVPALTRMLSERSSSWAISAAIVLGDVGPEGLRVLISELRSDDVHRRRIAAESFVYSKTTSPVLVPPLMSALTNRDCLVRLHSARVLLRIDPENEASVPALLALLRDKNNEFKEATISAFWDVAPKATAAIPTLISMLESDSIEVAFRNDRAVEILGRMGPAAKDAVPVLIKRLLKDARRPLLPGPAAEALGKIGPAAEPACADLRNLMNDTNLAVALRVVPAIALWRIAGDTNAVLPLVVQSLQAKSRAPMFGFRLEEEVGILGDVGPAARDAVPCLIKLLSAWHPSIRASAAEALRKIDPQAAAEALKPASQPAAVK